jgi:hypothetical protein
MRDVRCSVWREWLLLLLLTVACFGWQMAASPKPDKKKPFPGAAPPFKPKGGKKGK